MFLRHLPFLKKGEIAVFFLLNQCKTDHFPAKCMYAQKTATKLAISFNLSWKFLWISHEIGRFSAYVNMKILWNLNFFRNLSEALLMTSVIPTLSPGLPDLPWAPGTPCREEKMVQHHVRFSIKTRCRFKESTTRQ